MDGPRPNRQLSLAFASEGIEPSTAERRTESPAASEPLMEEILDRENLKKALKRVQRNGGSPGIDGMTVEALPGHLRAHWPTVRRDLLEGTYRPQPVRRVEIPKASGGVRKLGVPTALDRFVQQAVLQVLQRRIDGTFSESSYGFRPARSAHQAVAKAQEHLASGCRVVVDLDLEKFFDRVQHDVLMSRVARRVKDKRLLRLIRSFLTAGVMEGGLVSPSVEGTPQGGPLSPLLSNILLDDLDRELEGRGHRFVRYADDCNIYVRTERAGLRVLASVRRFLERRLRLKVNEAKSAVAPPQARKFLGFTFTKRRKPRRAIAPESIRRFRAKVKALTRRAGGKSVAQMARALAPVVRGWGAYFGFCETPKLLRTLDAWVRRRLRCVRWHQWRTGRRRYRELLALGVERCLAAQAVTKPDGPWAMSDHPALNYGLNHAYFRRLGLPSLATR